MSNINEITESIAENIAKNNTTAQVMGEDGLLHCANCGEPVQMRVPKTFRPSGLFPRNCRCLEESIKRYQQEQERERAAMRVAERQSLCFTDEAYKRYTFESDKGLNPKATNIAKWYVDTFEERAAKNEGLAFIGSTGTGKTFMACCIANALSTKGVPVWVTTVQPLLRKFGDFKTNYSEVIQQIRNIGLLVLDDYSITPATSKHNLDLMYEIIDTRKNSGKPLIITTNLTPADFKNKTTLEIGQLNSRLWETCFKVKPSPVIMTGDDIRVQNAKDAHT